MSLSIIIPVYNSSSTLSYCIDSVKDQISENDEIIIINDGSTDDSEKICLEYVNTYPNIKYFLKNNEGVSSARNLGILHASKEWIIFLDSDDKLGLNFLDNLKLQIKYDQYDWIMWSSTLFNKMDYLSHITFQDNVTNKDLFFNKYHIIPHLAMVWGKAYKNNIIKDYDITFHSNLDWGEDTIFNLDYFEFIFKDILTLSEEGYIYSDSGDGLSKKSLSFEYCLKLFILISNKLNSLAITDVSKVAVKHFYFAPLFHSIYAEKNYPLFKQVAVNFNKLKRIKDLGISNVMVSYFRSAIGIKKYFYIFLKFNQLRLFNLVYTIISKRW